MKPRPGRFQALLFVAAAALVAANAPGKAGLTQIPQILEVEPRFCTSNNLEPLIQ